MLQNNKKYGPYSEEQMRSFIGEGRLKGDALVWCKGMKGWARAADVELLISHFTGVQSHPADRPVPPARPAITPERHGGGRKAVAGALVIVAIVAGLGIWWMYPQLSRQPTQPQSGQPTQTGPAFSEADGALYTAYQGGVHDGDTIYVTMPLTRVNPDIQDEISDPQWTSYVGVRFARINAPELENTGGTEAKDFVKQLIASGGNNVYLDLDNLAVSNDGKRFRDLNYNRLVAVVYVYIDNKLVNVNAEVLRWGQENYSAHDWLGYTWIPSEFDEQEWLENDYLYIQ